MAYTKSNIYFQLLENKIRVFQCYAQIPSLLFGFMMMFFGAVFALLAKFNLGRKLLERFPQFFSAGAVSKQGPSREVAENTNFVSFVNLHI